MRAVVFVGAEVKEEGGACLLVGAGDTSGLRNTTEVFSWDWWTPLQPRVSLNWLKGHSPAH